MPYQNISRAEIEGAFLIQPQVFGDSRGWYCPEVEFNEFETATGIKLQPTQIASSFNAQKGILRGLHYQKPNSQAKLVQVVSGSVLDVAVDLRQNSPSFGRHIEIILTADQHLQFYIPAGCAHGYIALAENTRFTYLVAQGAYDSRSEHGVNPFDPELKIDWRLPREEILLKDRDLQWPNLKDLPIDLLF